MFELTEDELRQLEQPLANGKQKKEHRSAAAMCEGKPVYANGAEAWRALRHRNGRHGAHKHRAKLEPYHCPHCGRWHIGGKNG